MFQKQYLFQVYMLKRGSDRHTHDELIETSFMWRKQGLFLNKNTDNCHIKRCFNTCDSVDT